MLNEKTSLNYLKQNLVNGPISLCQQRVGYFYLPGVLADDDGTRDKGNCYYDIFLLSTISQEVTGGFSYHLREISNFQIAVSPRNGSAQNWPSIWFTFVAKVPHQGFPEWLQATGLCIHRPRLLLASFDGTPGQLDSSPLQHRTVPEVFSFDAEMGLVSDFLFLAVADIPSPCLDSCCSSQTDQDKMDLNLGSLWITLFHSVLFYDHIGS